MQQIMYPAQVNSPQTELSAGIDNLVATIPVVDAALLPAAPNLVVIGSDETAETILYTGKSGNNLTGCTRGFQGAAKAWSIGAKVARYFTAYDADTMRLNLVEHETRMLLIEAGYPTNAMSRQAIINGNFDVWQRGTSITNPTNGTYLADRWKIAQNNGGGTFPNIIHSKVPFASGDIIGIIPQAFYYYRVNPDATGTMAGSTYYQLSQAIEHGTRFLCGAGRKVTVSFYARSPIAGKKLGIDFIQNYGTGGSPTAIEPITGTTITLTSTWTKYTFTITTNTLVGKTFGTNNDDNLTLEFWYAWGSTLQGRVGAASSENFAGLGNIDIAQVQVCAGDVALPFQPRSFADESLLCQRYYEKSYDMATVPGVANNVPGIYLSVGSPSAVTGMGMSILFRVRKRVSPTVIVYDVAGNAGKLSAWNGSSETSNLPTTLAHVNETKFRSTTSVTSGTYELYGHYTADAEL